TARARRLAARRRLRQLELLACLCELELRIDHDATPDAARSHAHEIGLDALVSADTDGTPLHQPVITTASLCRIKLALLAGVYQSALTELHELRRWAAQHGAGRLLIELNILLAHAVRATGGVAAARANFDDAVGMAMFQGIVRPFIDGWRF